MARNLALRANHTALTGLVMGLAVAAFLVILTGCGGSEPDSADGHVTPPPVNCASSAVCS